MANFSLLAKLGLDSKAFQTGMKGAEGNVKSFTKNIGSLKNALVGLGLGRLAMTAIEAGSRISDLSTQLKINAEALQTLQFAAQEAGASNSALERGLRNVQLRTEEAIKGNKSYAEAFANLGINIEAFRRLPTEKKLIQIAKASRNASDQNRAFNDVARILGERAGPELREVLQQIATGFDSVKQSARNAGQLMSDETVKSMDDAADSIERAKKNLTTTTAAVLQFGFKTVEVMTNAAISVREGRNVFRDLAQAEADAAHHAQVMADHMAKMADQAERATREEIGLTNAIVENTESIEEKEKALRDLSSQIKNYFDKVRDQIKTEQDAFIAAKELEALELRAAGKNAQAEALEKNIELMKEAIQISREYGISLEKAAALVRGIEANKPKEDEGGEGGGKWRRPAS